MMRKQVLFFEGREAGLPPDEVREDCRSQQSAYPQVPASFRWSGVPWSPRGQT